MGDSVVDGKCIECGTCVIGSEEKTHGVNHFYIFHSKIELLVRGEELQFSVRLG